MLNAPIQGREVRVKDMQLSASLIQVQMGVLSLQMQIQSLLMQLSLSGQMMAED